jgi:hypothetical protein
MIARTRANTLLVSTQGNPRLDGMAVGLPSHGGRVSSLPVFLSNLAQATRHSSSTLFSWWLSVRTSVEGIQCPVPAEWLIPPSNLVQRLVEHASQLTEDSSGHCDVYAARTLLVGIDTQMV